MSYFEGISSSPMSFTLLLVQTGVCYVLELLGFRKYERHLWSKLFIKPGMVSKRISYSFFFILSITLIGIILVPAVWGGYIQSMINVSRGKKISIGQFLGSRFNNWGTLLGASLLYALGIILGFICLILPGIYLMVKWSFIFHLIVDQNKGVSESFSISGEIKW